MVVKWRSVTVAYFSLSGGDRAGALVAREHLPSAIRSPRTVDVNDFVHDQMPWARSAFSPCQTSRPRRTITSSLTPSRPTPSFKRSMAALSLSGSNPSSSGLTAPHAAPGNVITGSAAGAVETLTDRKAMIIQD